MAFQWQPPARTSSRRREDGFKFEIPMADNDFEIEFRVLVISVLNQ